MKRISILLTTFCCVIACYAQKMKHPSLLYTQERIELAKQRMKIDPDLAKAWKELKVDADKRVKAKRINDLDYLSLAYLMTKEHKFSDRIKEILLDLKKTETWGSAEMLARKPVWHADLGLSHKCYLTAIAFDAIYNDLSGSERKTIAKELNRLGLQPSLGDWLLEPTRIHSLNSMGHNWWTSCVCMGGILALSLQNE